MSQRVAVFSDVHGNLPALMAVLADIDSRRPYDEIIAAGDHCLNGPDPAASLDVIAQRCTSVLVGNADRNVFDPHSSGSSPGGTAWATIEWTRRVLGAERIEMLGRLPFERRISAPDGATVLVVHANPHDVDTHIRPDASDDELAVVVGDTDASVIAFGHLHTPFQRRLRNINLVNVAACGLPRDGDRRAVWGDFTWSPESGWTSTIHRVDYDYGDTILRLLDCGIPDHENRIRDLLRAAYD